MVRTAATILVCAQLAGCALTIQGPAKNAGPAVTPTCDTGKGRVVLDGIAAVGFAAGGLAVMDDGGAGAGAALLAAGGLLALSAYRGNGTANECQQAVNQHQAFVDATREARRAGPVAAAPPPREAPPPTIAQPPPPAPAAAPPPRPRRAVVPSPAAAAAAMSGEPAAPPKEASEEATDEGDKPEAGDTGWNDFWEPAP